MGLVYKYWFFKNVNMEFSSKKKYKTMFSSGHIRKVNGTVMRLTERKMHLLKEKVPLELEGGREGIRTPLSRFFSLHK